MEGVCVCAGGGGGSGTVTKVGFQLQNRLRWKKGTFWKGYADTLSCRQSPSHNTYL